MIELLFSQYKDYSNLFIFLELTAVIFGIISVLFARKNNILVYPTGLVSTLIFVYILLEWKLFGDFIINIYYSIMSVLGWYLWTRKKNGADEFPISVMNRKDYFISTLIFTGTLLFIALVYQFFDKFTDWTAYVDTLTTALFFVGMWLMAKRKIENWIIWIVADIISVPLYFYKGLTFSSMQFLLFTIIAILGYLEWKKTFTEADIKYINERGNSLEKVQQQLDFFIKGIPKINLVKSATIGDGIWRFSEEEILPLVSYFDKHKNQYTIEKFVPASGAATRMFKFLNEFLNEFDEENDTINSYINKKNAKDVSIFIFGLKNFPFYRELKEKTIDLFPNYYSLSNDKKQYVLIKTLLSDEGLHFSHKPKGILPFHVKGDKIVTPIEENIFEADFFKKENDKTKIHFTITKEFQADFEKITNQFSDCEINFSYQDQSSDTLAVNEDNTPFRVEDDKLFFRPGGHGALIENLNALQSDVIYIKNIDNVSQNHKSVIATYKKVLGGVLIRIQYQIFNYLKKLSEGNVTEAEIAEIRDFAENKTAFPLPEEFNFFQTAYKIEYLIKVLNRPIRVCGMVKNEGEPGGGPFWVQDDKGRLTLQIVESSQIDLNNKIQKRIAKEATHFNPVDIVCGVKNFKGEKFDLNQFIDQNAAFITEKTKNGKPIKAFELPGLWNGAMAKWTTIFVEVPLETFNPVKTVNDLLKSSHQPDNG